MPLKMHEHILIFGESASVYNPQMTYGSNPYKKDYNHAYGIKNAHRYGIKGVHTDNHGERHPISVQEFQQKWRRQDQLHPTQKPVDLIRLYCFHNKSNGMIVSNSQSVIPYGKSQIMQSILLSGISFISSKQSPKYILSISIFKTNLTEYCLVFLGCEA